MCDLAKSRLFCFSESFLFKLLGFLPVRPCGCQDTPVTTPSHGGCSMRGSTVECPRGRSSRPPAKSCTLASPGVDSNPLHRRKVCSMTECLNTAQNTSISYLLLLQKFMTDLASSNNIYLSSPSFGGKKYRGLDWLHCGGLTSCSLPALWSETPGRTNVKCAWAGAALGCLGPQS